MGASSVLVRSALLVLPTPPTEAPRSLAITWLQRVRPLSAPWDQRVSGGGSGERRGWKVIFALSGNVSGWRIDSADKSTSQSGQSRWSAVGRRALRIEALLVGLTLGITLPQGVLNDEDRLAVEAQVNGDVRDWQEYQVQEGATRAQSPSPLHLRRYAR
jgi:hypothetical protein